ncbi:MAG: hypothetical protein KDE09_10330 [Anaerolineales bacterium]|nr:hypothetical protein [Anaerolineales bacterium]MCB8961644.1 hypothetical protein [Ardenticatenales bacterium]MCB0005337.1 hypothetical protein [Anaerolineales bacterium]MCB0010964.1 hypothetical protein [Anaerolineales bacterium]MCB0018174.1 hypothetical protein [Anaerolineales bacterium]
MMLAHESTSRTDKEETKLVYEKPAIIAEGNITVRAGSTGGSTISTLNGAEDDIDLFTEPNDD